MSDDNARPETGDLAAVAAGLQEQIDDLTATVEAHQRLFERLRSAGVLRADGEPADPGGR